MQFLKVEVKPNGSKGITLRLFGRDDAGHILVSTVTAPDRGSVSRVLLDAQRSMQALAAKYTEEEQYQPKGK